MSASAAIRASSVVSADPERRHRMRIVVSSVAAIIAVVVLAVYGADYYWLDMAARPYSSKHGLLRSSGSIGLSLGVLAVLLFFGIYLYYFRKRWKWLSRLGSGRHWLDFHVVMGLTAPALVAFHAAFKFRGMAGVAFWIMAAVAISGVVGRYLYAQIPRRLNTVELSWQEIETSRIRLEESLASQKLFAPEVLRAALQLPDPVRVGRMSLTGAIALMLAIDLARPLRGASLRRRVLGTGAKFSTLGGLLSSGNRELEWTIEMVRKQSTLRKKIIFLSRSQQVFHLWHVVHRPFSYAFVVLALIHICAALLLGYL